MGRSGGVRLGGPVQAQGTMASHTVDSVALGAPSREMRCYLSTFGVFRSQGLLKKMH